MKKLNYNLSIVTEPLKFNKSIQDSMPLIVVVT